MDRKGHALKLRSERYNCAQAVICAFADKIDIKESDLKRIGAAFGGGMGCLKGNCGALIGAQILLGLMKYEGMPIGRDASYVLQEFERRCGDITCSKLKGIGTGEVLCSCPDCIMNAVGIIEDMLEGEDVHQ